MSRVKREPHRRQVWRLLVVGSAFSLVVVLLLMWLAGTFHSKVDASSVAQTDRASSVRKIGTAKLVVAHRIRVPRTESAVGSIKAQHEADVASKLLAKVLEVRVKANQHLSKGDVLVRLDKADLEARLEQAVASAKAAQARRDQARTEYERIKSLMEQDAAAKIEWDRVQTAYDAAKAELERANQAVKEARTILGYATVTSPIDGIVIDKQVEAGDTVTPGQVLVKLYDPTRMQLVARVRESLTHRLKVNQMIGVRIDSLRHTCKGRVSEIVPEAESASRTFTVKVTGPCPPGVYTGMFGRLLIPLEDQDVLVIPRKAVHHVGQLELVDVADGDVLRRRAVKTGKVFGDEVQVLAGLREGETVAITRAPTSDQAGG